MNLHSSSFVTQPFRLLCCADYLISFIVLCFVVVFIIAHYALFVNRFFH